MASLSSPIANWNSQSDYKYGDTVLHSGEVYLAVVANPVTGRPPFYANPAGDWFNLDPNAANIPRPVPSAITNFRQVAATWDPENGYGSAVVEWDGGEPNKGFTATVPTDGSIAFFPELNRNSGTIVGVGGAGRGPGFSSTAFITALSISGTGNVNSATIPITTLGFPPAPTITLVAASVDATTGLGSVAITFTENNLNEFTRADSFIGFAVGSPNVRFSYNRALGTATFDGIIGNAGSPPISYDVYMRGINSVGEGPDSNHLNNNIDPQPPLPDAATNFAVVSFLVGGANLASGWVINTNNNPVIGGYDCNTGAFNVGGVSQTNPIPLLLSLQAKGVRVILSLGGATFNVAAGLTNGTALAQNIAHAFFGASVGGWVPYGSTSTPPQQFYFDGLDLDWEGVGPADLTQLTSFVTTFRTLCPTDILTMSPQPPYSASGTIFPTAFNANGAYSAFPTAQSGVELYNPAGTTPALLDQNYLGYFDYVFVQYYNNADWEPGAVNFKPSVTQWAAMASRALPRTRPSPPAPPVLATTRLVLGFASADAERLYDPVQNSNVFTALAAAQTNLNSPSVQYLVAGSGFWNSPSAQGEFAKLYDPTSGIANLPSDVIFMWLNQNTIDPNWATLPIFDGEEPGVLLPPLSITVNNAVFPAGVPLPLSMGCFSVTVNTPPANLNSITVKINKVNPGTNEDNTFLSEIPSLVSQTTAGITTYFYAIGIAYASNYRISVEGFTPTGRTQLTYNNFTYAPQPPTVGHYLLSYNNIAPPYAPGTIRFRIVITSLGGTGTTPNIDNAQIGIWYGNVPVNNGGVGFVPVNWSLLPISRIVSRTQFVVNPVNNYWESDIVWAPPYETAQTVYFGYTYNQPGIWGSFLTGVLPQAQFTP
jgi:hypothetical protein